MGSGVASDWIILRCSGRNTLNLAASLAEDGFEVWAPIEIRTITASKRAATHKVELPVLAGYVFARASHLVDLLELASMPVKPRRGAGLSKPAHRSFSVFHYFDRIPLIADHHLNHLRRIARRRSGTPKADKPFKKYQTVRVEKMGDAFHGKSGVVQKSGDRETVVCFDGRWDVTIATFMLVPEENSCKTKPVAIEDGYIAARKAA